MSRPLLLDLFCCAGGVAMGYHRAGFDVVGVDITPQPRYPFAFVQGDALAYLAEHGHRFDAIHASPPCQAYTVARNFHKREHPELVEPVRALLQRIGKPWVMENVPGSPLIPTVILCGTMFGLNVYRHRLFESNVMLLAPAHGRHTRPCTPVGRAPKPGEVMTVAGHFSGIEHARAAMGIDWMNRAELAQSIPPAYTEHIGRQLMAHVTGAR